MGFLDASITLPTFNAALAGKVAKGENVARAKDYGAKGDGVTDDTAALQAMIADAITKGIPAFIGPGTYKVTAPLRSTGDGLTLRLANSALINRYHNNNMFINGAAGTTTNGYSNIEISGGTWDLRGAIIADFGSAFSVGKASNIYIHDTTLKNNCMSHMVEMAGVTNVLVERIQYGGYIDTVGNRNYVEAFQLERITATGFPSFNIDDLTPCANITVRNCAQIPPETGYSNWPTGVGTHATDTGGVLNSNVKIYDNNFGTCTFRVLRIGNWVGVKTRNNIGTAPTGVTVDGDGTTLNDVTLDSDTITSTNASALILTSVVGLTSRGCRYVGQTNGVSLAGCESVRIIDGNVITANTFDAFLLFNTSGVTKTQTGIKIANNVVLSARAGAYVQDDANKVTILGNDFRNLTSHGVSLIGTVTGILVDGNMFILPSSNRVVNFATTVGKAAIAGNMYPLATTTFQNGTASQAFTGTNFAIL